MPIHLRPHVHAIALGEDLVILDTAADAYLCLPGAGGVLGHGGGALRPGSARDALEAAGLTTAARTDPRPALPPLPSRSLPVARPARRPGDRRRLLLAAADLLWSYWGRGFAGILRRAEGPGGGLPPEEILRLSALFAEWAPWLPIPGKCLVRSFVLLRVLQRAGGQATWVFGVRTWPFGAHCWLQLGEVALDDDPARLVGYAPILAVGG